MKKLFFTSILLLCTIYSFSQSLSGPSSTIATGSINTITATGETSSAYFSSVTYNSSLTTTTAPSPAYYSSITASIVQYTNYYNITTQQATEFTLNVANSSNQIITVKLAFDCVVSSSIVGVTPTNVVKYVTISVNPVYRNTAASSNFTRNNCATGGTPNTVTYTVPANTYTSTISQADADSKATADISANGQTYANTNGTCTFYNVAQSGNFTQTYCPTGTPDVLPYSIAAGAYTSLISQADADSKAATALATQGQSYVDGNGTCGGTIPVITLTNPSSKVISISYTIPSGSWYVKITVRDNATGITTSSTQAPGVNTISVPTALNTYTVTLTVYSSTYPSGTSSVPKDIYVTF